MKITGVRPILLSAPYGTPDDLELKRAYPLGKRSAAFVVVETDAGVTGLGETYAGVFVPELAAQLLAALGERIVGQDPFAIHAIHSTLVRYVSYWGYTGFAKNVISAIEIALWDLDEWAFTNTRRFANEIFQAAVVVAERGDDALLYFQRGARAATPTAGGQS